MQPNLIVLTMNTTMVMMKISLETKKIGNSKFTHSSPISFNTHFNYSLYSLSEVQREDILAERYQKRKQAQERRQLRNKLKRDRNLVDSSPSLSNRRASKRVKSSGSEIRADALSDLISKRSQRAKAQTTTSDTEYDRIPKDDDSDTDFVIQEDKKPLNETSLQEPEDFSALPANVLDIEKIRLSRSLLEEHFNKPKFNKLVAGFFIRIGLGMTADKVPVYRVTTIAGMSLI